MAIQEQILIYFESIRNDFLTMFFSTITIMAEHLFLVIFLAVLYWLFSKQKAKKLAWFVLFNGVANGVIKNIINMPRPFERGVVTPIRMETATGSSFPSGHTQTATSFWSGGMLLLRTKESVFLGAIMIILTALSRLYLGVHWPMDVLGGIGFGVIFTYFAAELIDEEGTFTRWHVIASSIICLGLFILDVSPDLYKTAACLWGLCFGGYLEQQYIQFKVDGTKKAKLIRVVIGIVGVLIIYLGMSKLLPAVKMISMTKYALVILWIIAGAPCIFKKIRLG